MRTHFRIPAWLCLPLALAAFTPSSIARAAQNAEVTQDSAPVYDSPSEGAQEIDYLSKGTLLRVSSQTREGWYKIVIPGRTPTAFGWVKSDALRPSDLTRDIDAAGIQRYSEARPEKPIHRFVVSAGARGLYVAPEDMQSALGFDSASVLAMGFGAEFGYRLNTQWTVGARFFSQNVSEEKDEASYAIALSSFGAYGEWTFEHSLPFKVGFSLGVGTLSAGITGTDAAGADLELTSDSSMIVFPAKFVFQWYPLTNVAISLGAGYQYALSEAVFVDDADNETAFNASAPFAEAGLQIEF